MSIVPYLAMTAAEFGAAPSLPEKIGWMACHFSPYSTGLSNLPERLPKGSLLILNDRTPIHGHDPRRVADTLAGILAKADCCGLLLDFQEPHIPELQDMAGFLAKNLSCKVIISQAYALEKHPVFLPPVPPDTPLADYLAPWKNQEIWLEAALDGIEYRITQEGSKALPCLGEAPQGAQADRSLHCHYQIEELENAYRFRLFRTKEDLAALLAEADTLGVTSAVGLYQELG